jgi:hypothetical protein
MVRWYCAKTISTCVCHLSQSQSGWGSAGSDFLPRAGARLCGHLCARDLAWLCGWLAWLGEARLLGAGCHGGSGLAAPPPRALWPVALGVSVGLRALTHTACTRLRACTPRDVMRIAVAWRDGAEAERKGLPCATGTYCVPHSTL